MIRTSAATGAVVGATLVGGSVDDELGAAVVVAVVVVVVVVVGLAAWLLEHAASARNATVADDEATRDRRIARS